MCVFLLAFPGIPFRSTFYTTSVPLAAANGMIRATGRGSSRKSGILLSVVIQSNHVSTLFPSSGHPTRPWVYSAPSSKRWVSVLARDHTHEASRNTRLSDSLAQNRPEEGWSRKKRPRKSGVDLPVVILPAADHVVGGHDRHRVEQGRGHLEQRV